LQDERGYTADLGYRGRPLTWLKIDGSLFLLHYKNKIGQVLKADQAPLFIDYRWRTNVAAARSMGIEALIDAEIFRSKKAGQLHLYGNFAYTHARYLTSAEPGISGKQIELVPPIIIRSGVQHFWKSWKYGVQYSWVDQQFSDATNAIRTSSAVEGIIPSYGVADISLSYQQNHWKIESSINNLFNRAYFTRRADGYPGPGIIPSDARAFFITLQYQW
jgi:Fe(3+) dicitrate transport protein